ncbi:MAG: cation-translocating P-type ATPase [Phycisphaeraceae bacterium]|nr:cation-translocating P-type ATPase [Phycisphaeraceae bacterium]
MAHDFVKHDLQISAQQGRMSLKIAATLLGGTLLLTAFAARFLFATPLHASLLAGAAALLLGAPLVISAVRDLLHGHTHFNELIALAVLAAFAKGDYLEAGTVAFFTIISVLIESRTALGAQASIESLIKITPTRARRLTDGREEEMDAALLKPGDVVRVLPGDNIPADGLVLKGQSTVNQASITGESLPADKTESDEVYSGTINLTGAMDIKVTKAGADTTLGRVKEMIVQAETTRIPLMRAIDRYAAWYTPTIVMIVGIVLFLTLKRDPDSAWSRAIAMLVIACPCALILATPTAMVAALSAAARLGVLVKSVVDLESARNLTAMIFDKTGTLTTGELEVTRLSPAAGVEPVDLLRAAAAAEQSSRHPVARALTAVAQKARLDLPQPTSFQEVPGRGVAAICDGQRVLVGRAEWLLSPTDVPAAEKPSSATQQAVRAAAESPEAEGLSLLFVLRAGKLLGWIGLADNTRPQAAAAMDRLRDLGLKRLFIVTGDRESVARRVAAQMHTEYKAQVLPHEKLEMVDHLKAAGHRVAVVGDGVNDAPALAAGDVSIAMGAAGSDVAIHSATIALMNNNLNRIPFLIELSRRTFAVIMQNLVIGLGFILIFGGLALAGWIAPWLAAVLHMLSGLLVIFNSARLVRSGEDIEHAEAHAARRVPSATRPTPQIPPAATAAALHWGASS